MDDADHLAGPDGDDLVVLLVIAFRGRTLRKGKAPVRLAQGMGTRSIKLTQRSARALTKCPWLERTGSR